MPGSRKERRIIREALPWLSDLIQSRPIEGPNDGSAAPTAMHYFSGSPPRPTIKSVDIDTAAVQAYHIQPGTVVRRIMVGSVPQTDRIVLQAGTGITVTAVRTVTPADGNKAGSPRSTITIANSQTALNFADAELPSGTINGANTHFTLHNQPSPPTSLSMYLNGAFQYGNGVNYTLVGNAITFAVAPPGGANLTAFYRY